MPVDREHILRLYAYHHWAEDRLLDAFAPITAAQLDRQWGGSFGTGRALLRHVVGVDRVWCDRWSGTSPEAAPEYPASHTGKDFRAEWEKIKKDQDRFLQGLSRERLGSQLTYVNLKGETWTYPVADVLVHVANHGTYHRGQLAHLLRDLGQAPPSTDYLDFLDGKRSR